MFYGFSLRQKGSEFIVILKNNSNSTYIIYITKSCSYKKIPEYTNKNSFEQSKKIFIHVKYEKLECFI